MGWYDRAEVYDTLFDWDASSERDFVLGASARWGIGVPERVLEPFCGPGRMLRAMPGRVIGFDLNRSMLARSAARGGRVFRSDAAGFAVAPGSFDLAFCLIDSFRYLMTEEAAFNHLRCVGQALRPGAVYVLGFDLTGHGTGDLAGDEWEADGWHIRVRALADHDAAERTETMHVRIEGHGEVIEDFQPQRTYTHPQFEDLIDTEGTFEVAAAFAGRYYDLDRAVELSDIECSAVFVLRR